MDAQNSLKKYAELLPLFVKHKKQLKEKFKSDSSDYIDALKNLPLFCKDGKIRLPQECIFIQCSEKEPFTYISLPNQAICNSQEEGNLIKDIVDRAGGTCVTELTQWQQAKINQYIKLQDKDINNIVDIHYEFINELAYTLSPTIGYPILPSQLKLEGIQLINRKNAYHVSSDLTLGNNYEPDFAFESCGIDSLNYLSDTYLQQCSNPLDNVFREMRLHSDFLESDIPLLENRSCAFYFWTEYLQKGKEHIRKVKKLIEDKKLDSVKCIPTQSSVLQPNQVYYGDKVNWSICYIEDGKNKFPSEDLQLCKLDDDKTLFDLLPMKKSLRFLDALYALLTVPTNSKHRKELLHWIVDSYAKTDEYTEVNSSDFDDIKSFHDAQIEEYKKDANAVWRNGKEADVHISKLYALAHADKERLIQHFGSHELVISTKYMPDKEQYYSKVCEIFKIEQIHYDDLETKPNKIEKLNTQGYDELRLSALFIAGFESQENWKELFETYKDKLNSTNFYACDAIVFFYKNNEAISQSRQKIFTKNTEFYYKKTSLGYKDGQIFIDFLKHFREVVLATKLEEYYVSDILHNMYVALDLLINEHVQLLHDNDFVDTLLKYAPNLREQLQPHLPKIQEISEEKEYTPTTFTSKILNSSDGDNPKDTNTNIDDLPLNEANAVETNFPIDNSNNLPIKDTTTSQEEIVAKNNIETHVEQKNTFVPTINDTSNRTDITSWKEKETPQKVLMVQDPEDDELEKIRNLLSNSLSDAEIIDNHLLVMYRLYNYLISKGVKLEMTIEEMLTSNTNKFPTDEGDIYAQGAMSGILFISQYMWNMLRDRKGRLCIYYGKKASDFELIDSEDRLIEYIGKDNILIQISGQNKIETIGSIFNRLTCEPTTHALIRIKSNERYNSLFTSVFNSNLDNNFDI